MAVHNRTNSGYDTMEHLFATCCRFFGLLVFVLLTGSFSLANAQSWNGNGPFPPGASSRTVHALAIDPGTGKVYAGTGSGTVFALADKSLSQPPVASDDFAITDPGVAIGILVLANDDDPEGALDVSSVAIQVAPSDGMATANSDGTVTYAPNGGFVGVDSFTYTVDDLAGSTSNEATVTVRVNAPPTAEDDAADAVQNEPVTIDVLANDSDPDGALVPATVEISDTPENGSAIVEADGRITYQSAANFTGVDTFAYTVGDGDGAVSNPATVTVTVSEAPTPPSNTSPVAHDDTAAVAEGASITVLVLENDDDTDGQLMPGTVAVQGAPGNGSTEVNNDGSIRYTPDAGFSGNDSFTYTVEDDDGAVSNAATVSVTVSAAGGGNAAPAASDDLASTEEGVAVAIDVLVNDSDADGTLDPATVTIETAPDSGSADVGADGTVTYTPEAAFTGTDSFTYTVQDDEGASSNTATVQVTVSAAGTGNDTPAAADDAETTDENTPVTIDVLANDSDSDGTLNPATVTVQTEPGEGSVVVNSDGTITYTPGAGFSGTDTFTYTVADNVGAASDAATVTVTVNAAANPPSGGGGGGGGGGGAAGLLLIVAMTFSLFLRRAMTVGRSR